MEVRMKRRSYKVFKEVDGMTAGGYGLQDRDFFAEAIASGSPTGLPGKNKAEMNMLSVRQVQRRLI